MIVRRLLAPLAVLTLLSLGLSACEPNVEPDAASVNGSSITTSTLDNALTAIAGDPALRCVLAADSAAGNSGVSEAAIEGAGSGTFSSQFVASQLTSLVKQDELSSEIEKLHLSPSAAAAELATQRLESELNQSSSSGSSCTASGATLLAELTPSYRSFLIGVETDQDALAASLAHVSFSPAGLSAWASAHPRVADLACVSAILVSSLAAAKSARAAIVGGASFATVAKAKSTDSSSASNGGALGCYQSSAFESPLNTAVSSLPTGQLSEPISFSGSYVVLEVTSRNAPTEVDALDALVNQESVAEAGVVAKLDRSATVHVDPRYGRWVEIDGAWQVVPPSGPADADLSNPTAITPTPITAG